MSIDFQPISQPKKLDFKTTTPPPPPTPQPAKGKKGVLASVGNVVGNFGLGALKGAAKTVSTVGKGGKAVLENTAGRVGNVLTGQGFTTSQDNPRVGEFVEKVTTPTNTAQKVGSYAEQVAEFFIPGGVAGKVGKGFEAVGAGSKAIKGAKIATEAAGTAGVTLGQGGSAKDAAGNVAAAGAFGLAAKGVGKVADKVAPRVINSLIKPLSKDFEFGKNPGLGVVREKITANSFEDLIKKLQTTKSEVGSKIGEVLDRPAVAIQRVDLGRALAPIDDALERAVKTGDQTMVNGLLDFRNSITNEFKLVDGKLVPTGAKNLVVNPRAALDFKSTVGDSVRWREGIDNELNKVKTKVYRQARDLVEEAVEQARKTDKTVPSISPLNERYANLTSAETAAKYRQNVTKRLNLTTLTGGITGGIIAGPSAIQNAKEGNVEGLVKDLLTAGAFGFGGKALGSVATKTRVAKAIASLSPEQKGVLSKAIPLLKNVFQAQNAR